MRTKALLLSVLILFSPDPAFSQNDVAEFLSFENSFRLEGYFSFDDLKDLKYDTDYIKKEKNEWIKAIVDGANLLPEHVFRVVREDKKLSVTFFVDEQSWITATPMDFNLMTSAKEVPDWMTWEPFPINGYSREEKLFIAIHEMGHLYDLYRRAFLNRSRSIYETYYYLFTIFFNPDVYDRAWGEMLVGESSPTLYGERRGELEDFAESFALYVMWPGYLKNFPERYALMKDIFKKEYFSSHEMPNSVRSKLSVPVYLLERGSSW